MKIPNWLPWALIAVLVGAYVTNYNGFADWVNSFSGEPGDPIIKPTTTTTTTQTGTGNPYQVKGKIKFVNGTAAAGETVTIYTDITGSTWKEPTSLTTDSSGYYGGTSGPTAREGQQIGIHVNYNATSIIQDQWSTQTMPSAPMNWDDSYLIIDDTIIEAVPTQSTDIDIIMYHSDGSAVGATEATGSGLSKTSTSYLSTDETFTISLFVKQKWTTFGGSWSQPATIKGNDAIDYTSVVRVSLNTTSGFIWKSSGWTAISGQATTTNKTIEVPAVAALDTQPTRYDITLKINFAGTTVGDGYEIKVDWIDSQDWDTIVAGSETTRVAPDSGYMYSSLYSEKFYVEINS